MPETKRPSNNEIGDGSLLSADAHKGQSSEKLRGPISPEEAMTEFMKLFEDEKSPSDSRKAFDGRS